jgi:hypothetical protein
MNITYFKSRKEVAIGDINRKFHYYGKISCKRKRESTREKPKEIA